MQLHELIQNLKLSYHDSLNPKLWNSKGDTLHPKVAAHLLKVAQAFSSALNLPDGAIVDCVLTGSNANYNWTNESDVDLHLIVDYDKVNCNQCSIDLEDCLLAKKTLWNDQHDITVYGFPIEVYASRATDEPINGSGAYSIMTNQWLQRPVKLQFKLDQPLLLKKSTEIAAEIDQLIINQVTDPNTIEKMGDKLWRYRKSGLSDVGEFSVENLVFKTLRNNGYIEKFKSYVADTVDQNLSLGESLDSGVKYVVKTKTPDHWVINFTVGSVHYTLTADNFGNPKSPRWDVVFFTEAPKTAGGAKQYGKIGTGNELKVFATVIDIIGVLIKETSPNAIMFDAALIDGQRGSLYKRMATRYQPPGYDLDFTIGAENMSFTLVKR